ncbi:MAG: bifunctional glycosyltransferase/CDP-glycerol:glycerophosphate glycerophosphotransferase [Nocardioides sp.]
MNNSAGLATVRRVLAESGSGRAAAVLGAARSRMPLWRGVRRPELSVIVPFYNVEAYLAECLDSLLAQSFTDFEVILVDDGSPDGSREVAESYVAKDRRVRVVARPNGGLGAARNTGIRESRGRYLTFVDSDDVIPAGAWAALVGSARRSGSDIAIGAPHRFNSAGSWSPRWVESVHCDSRIGIELSDFPAILRNLYTWDKVFRRDFWEQQGLWFREGVAYEDQPIITQLMVRARAIDVISDVVYSYRMRDDHSSISQQTASLSDLRDRIAAWRVGRDVLRDELGAELYDDWLVSLFDTHFQWYLASPGTDNDTYWAELVEVVREFANEAGPQVWNRTAPSRRILVSLALADRRRDAQEFVRRRGDQLRWWPATLRPDGVLVELPFFGDPELPESHFVLRPSQLPLWHSIENIRWSGDHSDELTCEISGRAYLGKVDLARHPAQISVVLENTTTGQQHEFRSLSAAPTTFPLPTGDDWCDYEPGTFQVSIPWSAITDAAIGVSWRLLLRITVGELCETRPVTSVLRRGAAGWVPAAFAGAAGRVLVEWQLGRTIQLRMIEPGCLVDDIELTGRTLRGRVVARSGVRLVALSGSTGRHLKPARLRGHWLSVTLPNLDEDARTHRTAAVRWHLKGVGIRLRGRRGGGAGSAASRRRGLEVRPLVPARGPAGEMGTREELHAGTPAQVIVETSRAGELLVRDSIADVVVDEIVPDPDGNLQVTGRILGCDHGTIAMVASGVGSQAAGPAVRFERGRFVATLPLTIRRGRFGDWALKAGAHEVFARLTTDDRTLPRAPVELSRGLSARLPIPLLTDRVQGHLVRGAETGLQVALQRPIGAYGSDYQQNRLRTGRPSGSLTRGLLLRSYFGESATDSGVAIAAELRRRGSDLPVYWAVHGHSVPIPDGAIGVIVQSPQWYELINSASYYIDNMFQPEYHQKPAGQVVVQTFHGYPFKQMGLPHWQKQQFSQARIDSYLSRIRDWDFVVSPASYATPLLARDFVCEDHMLEIGYPRNDVLNSAEGDKIRAITRTDLGIRDDQTAVLYAPTFRDYLAKNDNRASWPDFFNLRRAMNRLGDGYVLLIRGHAFNARTKQRVPMPGGCIDVTDYPEVSDLYLAADAAVVDYSSLRFDFALTKKPMIFHVPDLKRYRDARGWLFDFELSAPGPLVDTTDQVVDHLLDLDSVRARWASAYATFGADYLDLDDGFAAARFVDAVFAPRGDA